MRVAASPSCDGLRPKKHGCGRHGSDSLRPKYTRVGHPDAGAMNLRPYKGWR